MTVTALVAPAFDWPTDPFSVIGGGGTVVATAFNAGLVVTGVVALPFAVVLWHRRSRAVGALYALVGVGFAGAGVFPMPLVLHAVFAVAALFGVWALAWADAAVAWRGGQSLDAAIAFAAGAVTPLAWLPYDLGIEAAQPGMAGAELLTFLAFAAWSGWTTGRVRG